MDMATGFSNVNWLSVIVAAVSTFLVGGIWYGPLFGRAWMQLFNFTEDDLKKRSLPKTFGGSLLLAFIAAFNLEMFLGSEVTIGTGAFIGFLTGFGWVATFLGILYLFEMQTLKAFMINAGYSVLSLTLMGAILGAW